MVSSIPFRLTFRTRRTTQSWRRWRQRRRTWSTSRGRWKGKGTVGCPRKDPGDPEAHNQLSGIDIIAVIYYADSYESGEDSRKSECSW
jgi:hypothetical protein